MFMFSLGTWDVGEVNWTIVKGFEATSSKFQQLND